MCFLCCQLNFFLDSVFHDLLQTNYKKNFGNQINAQNFNNLIYLLKSKILQLFLFLLAKYCMTVLYSLNLKII